MTGPRIDAALFVLLALSTLGQGGAEPTLLLAWHATLVVLLAAVWLGRGASQWTPARMPALGLLGFLTLALAGALRAPYTYGAVTTLLEIAAFGAVGWLAAGRGPALPSRLALPLLGVGALHGSIAVGQRIFTDLHRPASTFLNPNHLGAWLAAALLLGAGDLLARPAGRAAYARAALAVPALAGLWLGGSRGAQLAFGVGLLWLLVRRWPALSATRRRMLVASGVLAAILGGASQVARFTGTDDPYAFQRLRIWKASLSLTAERSWWGSGPGQFAIEARNLNFPDGHGPSRFERSFSNTHSDLLRLPCEFGWPAAIVALLGLAAAVRRGCEEPAAAAALAALAVQAAIADNLSERPALVLFAAILLGSRAAARRVSAAADRRSLQMLAGGTIVLLLVADVSPYLAWRVQHDLPAGRLSDTQRSEVERALRWNPLHPGPPQRLAGDRAATGPWTLDAYAEARELAERSVRLSPHDAIYLRGLARIEAQACRVLFRDEASRSRAARAYRRAADRSRYDPFVRLELAAFLIDLGDPAGALREARRVLQLEPNAVPARLVMADAHLALGQPGADELARRELAAARAIAASHASRTSINLYEEQLLRLDPIIAERIEQRLAEAAVP